MKKINTLGILAVCIILFTACAGNGNNSGNGNTTTSDSSTTPVSAQGAENSDTINENVKMVYGEISEVIGNAIVVKEIEMPEMRTGGMFNLEDMEGMTEFTLPDGTVVPIGEDGKPDFSGVELPEGMTFDTEGGGRMMFNAGGGDGSFAPSDDAVLSGGPAAIMGGEGTDGATQQNGRPQMRSIERAYTGEELEIIIPVGIPIMTHTRGENGIEESEVALTNLKSGDTITVIYKEDGKSIDSVSVVQSSSGGMGGMGGDMFFFGGPDGGGQGGRTVIIEAATVAGP